MNNKDLPDLHQQLAEAREAMKTAIIFLDDGHPIRPTPDRYRLVERLRAALPATDIEEG